MDTSRSLSLWKKVLYGAGDWGLSSSGVMRSVFYAIYLTDVVGLDARLASIGALIGILWDALNDPFVGRISDRLRTRWGRRRPFLLVFALPFGLSFILLWAAPDWDSQAALMAYVTLAYMLFDTLTTFVAIPFLSLTPELAPDYDDRTTLTGYRIFFQLTASLVMVVTAPLIVEGMVARGFSQQQGFILVAALFGLTGALPFLLIALTFQERPPRAESETLPLRTTLKVAWSNVPFRFAVGIHLLNWAAVDMVAMVTPFFLLYWVSSGNLLAKVSLFGTPVALESAFFGLLMTACILSLPFWLWFARKRNKQDAYLFGMTLFLGAELLLFFIQPGQIGLTLGLATLAGVGIATAYALPDSIFPDILEWDELRTRRRQEGIYYGARAFLRKLSAAMTLFLALQFLGWSGYQTPPAEALVFQQSDSALLAIRLLISPIGGLMILGALLLARFYPLTRDRHARIRRLLARRRKVQPGES
ncbi:MAG: MFS transporter [Anaerolineales bacterium]|nr:MFS transporter [Anaerolineales bacterium]MCX7608308.1 MFS transporter [Anaerolineales bacterium]MDW8227337.1 MFS transporter [Anaerolineales bacterium]